MRLTRALAALPLVASCHGAAPRDHTPAEILAAARAKRVAHVQATVLIETRYGNAEATAEGSVQLDGGYRSQLDVDAEAIYGVPTVREVVDGSTTYLQRPVRPDWVRFEDPYHSGVHPTVALEYLEDAGPLTRVGVETVRRETTVHYTAPAKSPVTSYDVWVDRDGLPLRVRMVFGKDPTSTKTFELTEWGRAPAVTLPPSSTLAKDVTAAYRALGLE